MIYHVIIIFGYILCSIAHLVVKINRIIYLQLLYVSINIVITKGVSSVSDYYQVRLSQFAKDLGSVTSIGANRVLAPNNYGFPQTQEQIAKNKDITERQKVVEEGEVVFDASPTLSESRTAEYVDQALPGPIGIVVYKMTGNRRFTISAKFISRTSTEGALNYSYVNLLRSWMIPQSQAGAGGGGKTGRPPILRLNGYKKQFNSIPVVLAEMSVNYPEDVDYIEVADLAMVPIIQSVDITLIESHKSTSTRLSDDDAEFGTQKGEFNLVQFRKGQLIGY